MKSCRTCGTKMHLNILPSSIQSLYSTPSSLINIFCNSVSLCNFFAMSLQYVSFFCSCCSCFGFNGSLISLRSSCFCYFDASIHPLFSRIFSKFATAKQSSFFHWLLLKLYLESLNCQLRLRILRMFFKFAVGILRLLFVCIIPFCTLFFQWFSRFLQIIYIFAAFT